ncbi:PREDICTED: transmembrane protein 87B [Tarenaya hassleriana]|uniref:transmembrane protein 87B n=1 Tax=Tarenaya hassleriana TaxID=28532 RepID=UPI00053CA478|nr:PREDICTED: transmembrane protein 87B [Tarenaya hassleriana]
MAAMAMDFSHLSVLLMVLPLLLCIHIKIAGASIHIYTSQPFHDVGNSLLLYGGSEGISAGSSSFIRFKNITFWRTRDAIDNRSPKGRNNGLVQAVIFEASHRNNIGGSAYGGQRSICCTPDLAKLQGCKQGEIIRIPSASDPRWPILLRVNFNGRRLSAKMGDNEIPISKSGIYNLLFISCDPKLRGLKMTGETIWKNPDGYLPGRMAPLMKFYGYMSLGYLLLSAIWLFQYLRFRRDILPLQHCITTVIVLGFLEMAFWYLDYANFNSTGTRPVALTSWVVTIGALRKTVSRILILCVSMGYGVVRSTLGGLTSKVLLVGVTYFIASEMLNIAEYVGTIDDISGRAKLFLVLPDAFLDAFLILWIFTSLARTLEQLQMKRTSAKLEIYRKFSNALAIMVVVSVTWIVYEVYFKATDPFNERWRTAWTITAFWDIIAFLLLCVICYLWAPSQNSQRYAYAGEAEEEENNNEEAESLTGGKQDGEISLVKQEKAAVGSDREDDLEEDKTE